MWKRLKNEQGEAYIDAVILVLIVFLMIGLSLKVLPVFIAKNELNSFAKELVRVAEIEARIGSVTSAKANELKTTMKMNPTIEWSTSGKIQLNEVFSVTVTHEVDIGFFEFGSFPITLSSRATGRSEVYWK